MRNYTLITGSSSGIGREIAILLSSDRNIILHGRNESRLNEVKLKCHNSGDVIIWNCDLSVIELVESSLLELIRVNDISITSLVHASGTLKMYPLKMIGLSNIYETLNVNFISAVLITKTLMMRINKSSLSSVVFISSNISNFGAKAMSSYAITKSALDSFMRCMAVELAPKVRFNSVLPGGVRTNMTNHIYENIELINRIEKQYPLGLGDSRDIANLVSFLLSDDAKWITGQQMIIDGGMTINISG